jgi:hypothetical protein
VGPSTLISAVQRFVRARINAAAISAGQNAKPAAVALPGHAVAIGSPAEQVLGHTRR